jgi:hypothetical protein
LVREGDGPVEAFGAGRSEPAVAWLAGQARRVTLLAPASWRGAVAAAVGPIERARVQTWSIAAGDPSRWAPGRAGRDVAVRRLGVEDGDAFVRSAPAWALRGWRSFPALIAGGAAVGVPDRAHGLAAVAWIFDQAGDFDAIAVSTAPRFRRLGLGGAAASALIDHIVRRRGRVPLWSTTPANVASLALARSLGFAHATTQTLVRWPPPPHLEGAADRTRSPGASFDLDTY